MPKYLIQASYTQQGVQGLRKEGGSSRKAHIEQVLKGLGGKLEAFYYAFGDSDVYVIVDMPDQTTATAVSLTVGASGSVSLKTTVLIEPEEVDAASKKSVAYRPPGS